MSDIPSEVFRKILLQLPAESLFRFRSVCKEWRRIIDDPSFIRSHANGQESPTTLPTVLIRTSIGTPIYYLSLDSLNYADGTQIIDVTRAKTLMKRGVPRLSALPVPSCNGLVLISHIDIKKLWVIWNILTREFQELPQLDIELRLIGSGLGYDYVADDYKVVRIDDVWGFSHSKTVYQTHIYSMKLDSWKRIKDCPCLRFAVGHESGVAGVYLNGVLHWRCIDMILALNLGTEDYRQMPLPPIRDTTFDVHLDAISGSLVISYFYSLSQFDGWLMKDYGVGESWMKMFSLGGLDSVGAMWNIRPIAYMKSKGQVLLQHDNKFFWLDIEKNTVKKFTVDALPHQFTSQIFWGSLVRLEDSCDVGGHVAVKIAVGGKRKRKKKNDRRLKFSVTVADIWCRSDSDRGSDSGWSGDDDEDN